MLTNILYALLGFGVCKAMGLISSGISDLFHVSYSGTSHGGGAAMTPAAPPGGLQVTSTAAPFPVSQPAGLPPFPSGWTPARPLAQDIIARAQVLLHTLPVGGKTVELSADGRWITYLKYQAGGKTGVTAYQPKMAVSPNTHSSVSPGFVPTAVSTSAPAASSGTPTLRRGSRGPSVVRWQNILNVPADGIFGRGTEAATKVWQDAHSLKPDGVVGPQTWAAANVVTT
jgi:peptidoglycan hydrolase-like protein with peptidoglycan-binding domain